MKRKNATYEQIKMFLTRIGMHSKVVINGDITQTDLSHQIDGGLNECIDRLRDVEGISICNLTSEDIVRNKIISKIIERL